MVNTVSVKKIQRSVKLPVKSLSNLRTGNIEQDIEALQDTVEELYQVIDLLLDKKFISESVDSDFLPSSGAASELLDGQFIRISQKTSAPEDILVSHGLGRIPQGIITIRSKSSENDLRSPEAIIEGDTAANVNPATDTQVTIRVYGVANDSYILMVF